jgi:hypothetical protein
VQFKRPLNARHHPFQNPAHIRQGEAVAERRTAPDRAMRLADVWSRRPKPLFLGPVFEPDFAKPQVAVFRLPPVGRHRQPEACASPPPCSVRPPGGAFYVVDVTGSCRRVLRLGGSAPSGVGFQSSHAVKVGHWR